MADFEVSPGTKRIEADPYSAWKSIEDLTVDEWLKAQQAKVRKYRAAMAAYMKQKKLEGRNG